MTVDRARLNAIARDPVELQRVMDWEAGAGIRTVLHRAGAWRCGFPTRGGAKMRWIGCDTPRPSLSMICAYLICAEGTSK